MERCKQLFGCFLTLTALCLQGAGQTKPFNAKVTLVAEGDLITVIDENNQEYKIRLSAIDAPEGRQDFGSRSRQSLSELILGKTVTVIGSRVDQDGFLLARIAFEGKDINFEQVDRGMAWFYRQNANELNPQEMKAYDRAEANARYDKRGLWRDMSPMPPWQFRAMTRREPKTTASLPAASAGEQIVGNTKSKTYNRPGCPDYDKVAGHSPVVFKTEADAEAAGYKKARNCP
jgi:endonuclease YncB( thermonuclease family)